MMKASSSSSCLSMASMVLALTIGSLCFSSHSSEGFSSSTTSCVMGEGKRRSGGKISTCFVTRNHHDCRMMGGIYSDAERMRRSRQPFAGSSSPSSGRIRKEGGVMKMMASPSLKEDHKGGKKEVIRHKGQQKRHAEASSSSSSSSSSSIRRRIMGPVSRLIQSVSTSPTNASPTARTSGAPKIGSEEASRALDLSLIQSSSGVVNGGRRREEETPKGPEGNVLQKWWSSLTSKEQINAYKIMLASVATIYGTNFGAIKYLDEAEVDVSIITAVRFLLATIALSPFLMKAPRDVVTKGLEVGLWVSIGYITQAIGLETTQACKSAFICSLSVVVVPIINGLIYNKRIPITSWFASLCACVGVGLLTLHGAQGPVIGDLWSLGQPLGFGMAFVRTEQCMQDNQDQALAVTAAQMLSVFISSFIWVSFTLTAKQPDYSILWQPVNAAALVYTGLITSAMAVVAESIALAYVPAEETTVILSTEPIWAAIFGAVVLGETLNGWGYLGAGIIVAGILLTQVRLPVAIEAKFDALIGGGDALEE